MGFPRRRCPGLPQQMAATSKLTFVTNGVIFVVAVRDRPRRLDVDPRAAETLDVRVYGDLLRCEVALYARRREDGAVLDVERDLRARRAGVEGDLVDADPGLLDRAVVVRA